MSQILLETVLKLLHQQVSGENGMTEIAASSTGQFVKLRSVGLIILIL